MLLQEFLSTVKPNQKKQFTELRDALLALPETDESLEIDEIDGEWCPVYRVKSSDLVWVHMDEHLWLSIPVDARFEKKVLRDENLDGNLLDRIRDAEDSGDVKLAKIEIKSNDDLVDVLPLLKLKHTLLLQKPEPEPEVATEALEEEEELPPEVKAKLEEPVLVEGNGESVPGFPEPKLNPQPKSRKRATPSRPARRKP